MVDQARRFASLNRLYGEGATDKLSHAHVMVVGLGGVGSWAVEALARSAVGKLTLVDMDHVAESNINRQIQAIDSNLGKSKVDALAERIAQYAPACEVIRVDDFLNEDNVSPLLTSFVESAGQVVLDCCDQTSAKVALTLVARRLKLKVALAGSAGGKTWPWAVQLADLRETTHDALLAKVRYTLRRQHGYPKDKKMSVPVFYSPQQAVQTDLCDPAAGLNCAGYGSAVAVTATMGMQMAGWAINQLAG